MKIKILFNRALLYFSYVLKLKKSLGSPVIKLIEPTNACMMNCLMCPRKQMKRKVQYMDFELFKRIIDQAKWDDNLWIHNFGDPLLHPKIIDMIKYVAKKGIKARISTNPNLLSEKMCNNLINSGLYELMISLDAIDDKTYKYIRGPNANYNTAVKNINRFLRLKKENKSKIKVTMAMVQMKANKYDVEKYKEIWTKEGMDSLSIHKISILDASDAKIVEQGDDELFSKQFKHKENNFCAEPWIGMVVTASGKVVTCCLDYDEKYIVGDLNKESLKDIWNNGKMQLIRKQVQKKILHQNPLCKTCFERNDNVLYKQIKYFLRL
jgi:radical SAM protein with 4Fe4S-binding SPASM domain